MLCGHCHSAGCQSQYAPGRLGANQLHGSLLTAFGWRQYCLIWCAVACCLQHGQFYACFYNNFHAYFWQKKFYRSIIKIIESMLNFRVASAFMRMTTYKAWLEGLRIAIKCLHELNNFKYSKYQCQQFTLFKKLQWPLR